MSTTRLCGCTRPVRDGYAICDDCAKELTRHLAEMPWLDRELEVTLTRQRSVTYNGARSSETPLPYTASASRARDALKAEMVGWVRILRLGNDKWPNDTLVNIAAWLLGRVGRIARHDEAWPMSQSIINASQDARAVVFHKPPDRMFLGRCDGHATDHDQAIECPGDVYAEEGSSTGQCEMCGRSYDVATTRGKLDAEMSDQLLTAAEIADYVMWLLPDLPRLREQTAHKRARDAIYQWSRRGRLVPRYDDGDDRALYRYGDVRPLLYAAYGVSQVDA